MGCAQVGLASDKSDLTVWGKSREGYYLFLKRFLGPWQHSRPLSGWAGSSTFVLCREKRLFSPMFMGSTGNLHSGCHGLLASSREKIKHVLGFSCRPNGEAPTWMSSKTSPIEPTDRGEGELSAVVKRRRAACPTRTRTSEWLCWEVGEEGSPVSPDTTCSKHFVSSRFSFASAPDQG